MAALEASESLSNRVPVSVPWVPLQILARQHPGFVKGRVNRTTGFPFQIARR